MDRKDYFEAGVTAAAEWMSRHGCRDQAAHMLRFIPIPETLSAPPQGDAPRGVTFNLNHDVWVRLTDAGRALYRKQWEDLRDQYPGITTEHAPKEEDDGGWSRWQLWELAGTFGHALYNGNPHLPFETEIRLAAPAPRGDAAPPSPEAQDAPTSPPWHPEYVKGWHAARAPTTDPEETKP